MAWVRHHLGRDARLGPALVGGVSSDVRLVTVGHRRAVLKRVTNTDWLAERPDLVAYEAQILEMLTPSSIPVPHVLAVDPDGRETGTPTLLLSWVEGQPAGEQPPPSHWLDALVRTACTISEIPPPPWVRPFRRYLHPGAAFPPIWSRVPEVWEAAIEIVSQPEPETEATFIHRDYHPWNVLWKDQVTGVVDWSQASVGPPAMDLAHCRHNLAVGFGLRSADTFLDRWKSLTGRSHDPYWDLVSCVDLLENWRPSGRGNRRLDAYVAELVAKAGGAA